jgi:hypothetical protein
LAVICALLSAAWIVWSSGYATCSEAELIEPAAIVAEARPILSWKPISGASQYRVEIESRVPEGRVLVALDTQVSGTRFRPPQPLTDFRSAVKVRVTAGCPTDDGSRLREKPASFQIDTSSLCPGPERIGPSEDGRDIQWSAVPAAIRYDVVLLGPDGPDIDVRLERQTQRTRLPLPATGETLIAAVRAYCPTGFGPRGLALVPSAKVR